MGTLKFFLFPLLMAVFILVESKTYREDIEFLKQLKNGLNQNSIPPGSCLSSWNFSFDPCDNLFSDKFTCGFRCDITVVAGTNRITEINLDQAGYSGSLSSLSWNLPFLQTLDFSNNFFSGSIPANFSNLSQLRLLSLAGNLFSGDIPPSLGSLFNLEELYLNNNHLTGEIPSSFRGLVGLKRLELQSNQFNGVIPEMGSLKNLIYFDGSDNFFSGDIPASFPMSLVQILMRNNSLEGKIPDSFQSLANLQVMDLSHNRLNGSVPAILFEHQSLEQISLSFNKFSAIETPTKFLGEVISVDLSDNEIHGFLPAFMGLMPKLSALSLENNKFSGMIPILYAFKMAVPEPGISPFLRLFLSGNYLLGPIPDPMRRLKADSVNVRLAGNCLFRCPTVFFFCQSGEQKSFAECSSFGPVIP